MYLREMGGVELLSREGEIAIAKRIEAGKDVMLIALSQSPITAQQFFEWDEKLQKEEILVREIIDIENLSDISSVEITDIHLHFFLDWNIKCNVWTRHCVGISFTL